MITIGLTGGIGTGKTYILHIFKELGCYALRADELAKNIIFSNRPEITQKIAEVFGNDIIDPDGGINKSEFSRLLFKDDDKRLFINRLIHPLVSIERRSVIRDLEKSHTVNFFVYESALLVESGIFKEFNRVIVAYTSEEEQIARLIQRDHLEPDEALRRIKAQFPLSEKLKVAHYTIDTSGSFANTRTKTLETFHLILNEFHMKHAQMQ
ncbi:MAG: dephospho-CoA kinase [Candidatus Omnitrophota bacterium]